MNHLTILRNVGLGVAVLITVVASTYKLSEAPAIWYDEGFYTQMAMNFAETGKQVLQTAPAVYSSSSYVSVGYPLIGPVALSYKMFGTSVFAGRIVMVFFILGCIAAAYLLIRRLYGPSLAAYSLFLIATFPMLYGNGKPVLGEVPGLFFVFLALLALLYLERTHYRDWRLYVLVGLLTGLCVATKMFFVLLLMAFVITLLLRWRKIKLDGPGFALGSLALTLPIVVWAYIQFGADASVASVLSYYANPYSVSNLGAQIIHNALRFVTEATPLYTLILICTWGASLYVRRKKDAISTPELAAYIFCILVLLSYIRLEGWYRYLFPATMVALVFFPSSLQTLYEAVSYRREFLKNLAWVPLTVVLLLGGWHLYQTMHASYVAEYYSATRTRDVSAALAALPKDATVFIYDVPELAILLPTHQYYQYIAPLPQVHIGEASLSALARGTPEIVLVGADFYKTHTEIFSHYAPTHTVDRYDILQKK